MALESATARIFLAACFFLLPIFLSHHNFAAGASLSLSFSFDFSKPSSYSLEDLRFEGNATLNNDLVDLTCTSPDDLFCSGRMSYNHPVPFYDNNTGEVASFVTTFTFSINMLPNKTTWGDGMAFFLSGYPSRLPDRSYGSVFGLRNWDDIDTIPIGEDRFVAVEFDTYHNPESDSPSGDHIGIDLNSLSSASTASLPRLNGTMMVTVTFDGLTRILEATLQYAADRSLAPATVKTQLPDQLGALLPPVVAVGFSAGTGAYTELHQIHSWSFNSTWAARAETPTGATKVLPGQDEGLGTEETTTGSNGAHPKKGNTLGVKGYKKQALAKGGLATLASALLLVSWSTLSSWKMKQKRQSFGKGSQVKRLEYKDLSRATGKFSDKNKIGAGSSGQLYKGVLRDKEVAVKKILKDSQGKFKDFLAELGTIGNMGHENVVKIEGWCCSISNFMFWCLCKQNIELFIVYEHVTNGNLHEHLYDRKEVLPWAMRFKIVKGLYSALNYLHFGCGKYILHRDIKPSNILLDDEFNAKLGDFGLSRAAHHDNAATSMRPTQVAARYMDPQCMTDGEALLRRSSDVYSFGIVLLEIAHGKYDAALFQKLHTAGRPKTFVEDFADEKLDGQFDKAEMERVIILGLRCSEQDVSKRPSLDAETLRYLEKGGELRAATIHEDEPRPAIAPV